MYDYLCTAAKPQPTALFSAIHMQGQKARQRAKEMALFKKQRAEELIWVISSILAT
jgi:hypothetical protein